MRKRARQNLVNGVVAPSVRHFSKERYRKQRRIRYEPNAHIKSSNIKTVNLQRYEVDYENQPLFCDSLRRSSPCDFFFKWPLHEDQPLDDVQIKVHQADKASGVKCTVGAMTYTDATGAAWRCGRQGMMVVAKSAVGGVFSITSKPNCGDDAEGFTGAGGYGEERADCKIFKALLESVRRKRQCA